MLRNTATDDILAVYKVGEPRPEVSGEPAGDAERRGIDRLGQRCGEGDAAGRGRQLRRMSKQPYRLPQGGLHRPRRARFASRFGGRTFSGHPGDTLASALLANGEHMVARSFKYHRPRGILGAGSEDPAALVEIGGEPRPHRSEHARHRAGALRGPAARVRRIAGRR